MPDDPTFREFWLAYPRHVAKESARKAWAKLSPVSLDLLQQMLTALAWQRLQPSWRELGGMYIPHPGTWLRQRRWEDEAPFQARALPAEDPAIWACPHPAPGCPNRRVCDLKQQLPSTRVEGP